MQGYVREFYCMRYMRLFDKFRIIKDSFYVKGRYERTHIKYYRTQGGPFIVKEAHGMVTIIFFFQFGHYNQVGANKRSQI